MTLREILNNIEQISDEHVIYARKDPEWDLDSSAVLLRLDDAVDVHSHLENLTYFLEIGIVKEVLEVWQQWRGRKPNELERIESILYYANNDAYLN